MIEFYNEREGYNEEVIERIKNHIMKTKHEMDVLGRIIKTHNRKIVELEKSIDFIRPILKQREDYANRKVKK